MDEKKKSAWWTAYEGKVVFVQFAQPAVVVTGNMEPLIREGGPAAVQGIRGKLSVHEDENGAWLTLRFDDPSSGKPGDEMLVTLQASQVTFIYVADRSVLHRP